MKILGADIIGLERAVMQNNSGVYTGVIVIDLSDLAIVTFNPTGDDGSYRWWPGVVELHHTGYPDFNETSVDEIKREITAHILTLRDSDMEPEDYSMDLLYAGSGLGRGESLLEVYRKHLHRLTPRW